MVGWHHWLDGHEFEQAPGVSNGQGSLVGCSPWGWKESDMTEQLNWTELLYSMVLVFAVHSHESAMGVHVSFHSEIPYHLSPHPIPLGCPRAPALSALLHASNLHWSSILHMLIYMFQCYSLKSSHPRLLPESKSLFFTSVSLLSCIRHTNVILYCI